MTTKQYTGLVVVLCVVASPFVAQGWLTFARTQHTYQEQLADEQQQADNEKQELARQGQLAREQTEQQATKRLIETLQKPIDKAWVQFYEDVTDIQQRYQGYPDLQIWCSKMLGAIQDKNFTLFNYLVQQQAKALNYSYAVYGLHYPDPGEPGLGPIDVELLSRFQKPRGY